MFILTCAITIGSYRFTRAEGVEIEKSSRLLADLAVIKVPSYAYIAGERVEPAKIFKAGDRVTIELGYEGVYGGVEYSGFVKHISEGNPIEIECEDNTWLLRQRNYTQSWRSTTIKEVLEYVTSDSGIELAGDVPDIALKPFYLKNVNGAQVLERLKTDYGLTVYFDRDCRLYAGLAYKEDRGLIRYTLPYRNNNQNKLYEVNVISSSLKYRRAEDVKLRIRAVHIRQDNTLLEVECGDPEGELRTLYSYDIANAKQLKEWAETEISKYKYTGYEGNITTFLIPYSEYGMTARVVDPQYGHDGLYYIEAVKTSYGQSGARREVELGIRV